MSVNLILFPARTQQARLEAMKRHPSSYGRNTVRLYHRTIRDAADAIITARAWVSRENNTAVFFSNRRDGQADGYGDVVLAVDVPDHLAQIDDEFPDGEEHYSVRAADLNGLDVHEA